ncbi:MAG: PHP domain-containing protein [Deltaproteobacteria bacterium]|jgi:predicted metal-dependent phosphoesterase TrpH|nr:PHP domain-containing protein [Deltaproteobacteria bacterium]
MSRRLQADLHVHTCLSPCADVKMSPLAVLRRARAVGLDILGISDHNAAENVPAALEAACRYGLRVLPGMEVTSAEEVHVLALFDAYGAVHELQEEVYRHLPGRNDEETFGMQVIANADDEVLGFNPHLLIGATTLGLGEVVQAIHGLGGLAVAAHFDRESYSLTSQLGFVPDDLDLDALEISPRISIEEAVRAYAPRLPLIQSSDAHREEEIGRGRTTFLVEDVSIVEMRKALQGKDGRRIVR